MDIYSIFANPLIGILLCLTGFAGKFLAGLMGAHFAGDSFKNGSLIGLGMVTKGGVGLIIAQVANQTGILSNEVFSSIVFMGIVLTIIPPIIFNYFVKDRH